MGLRVEAIHKLIAAQSRHVAGRFRWYGMES